MGLLEPLKYGEQFHKLCVNNYEKKVPNEKFTKHRKKKPGDKRKKQQEQSPLDQTHHAILEQLELEPNASKFAVFSAVRSSVLESETKLSEFYSLCQDGLIIKSSMLSQCCFHCSGTCKTGAVIDCRCHLPPSITHNVGRSSKTNIHFLPTAADNQDSDPESYTDETSEKDLTILQVPQIVGAGLRGLFELIAEARNVSPSLCTKALKALFDVIQGQIPESFKSEPNDLIQPLYDLLLDLATLHGPYTTTGNTEANNWSAIGCSSLLGLCVARGDTGKTLKAIAALLMSPKILANQAIQLPLVLSTLQRSIYSVALAKPTKPDWFKNGIPKNSLIDQFSLKNQLPTNIQYNLQPSIALNGKFIFILTGKSLLKIGTGFNDTLRGYVYAVNNEFCKERNGWIGFCGNVLFYKKMSKRSNESILIVNTETLSITGAAQVTIPPTRDGHHCLLFSDGDSLNAICTATKDDNLLVKQIYGTQGQMIISDLPLKLARKNFRTLGYAAFEDEVLNQNQIQAIQTTFNPFEPKLPSSSDQEVCGIVCGKEFGIVRATNGKVYYYGKSAALGLKSFGKTPTLKMTEILISKSANIQQVSIGHDGIHAILVNDDGTVYFAGTARRGEDGDTSKNRRQPKAVKPKKLSKIDNHFIVNSSCNNGTSAFVTKTGKLIMFGKDTAHCDSSGYVTDLLDQHITRVALGKAHCVALNAKGQLFTFGLNNKGQCGRPKGKDGVNSSNVTATIMETSEQNHHQHHHHHHHHHNHQQQQHHHQSSGSSQKQHDLNDVPILCDFEDHHVEQGQCRVCVFCRECTGYNISCVSTQNIALQQRIPGANCACGRGESGCIKCGACAICISLQEHDGIEPKDNVAYNLLVRQRSKNVLIRRDQKKQDESPTAPNVSGGNGTSGVIGPGSAASISSGADLERDTPRVAPLSPQKITLPSSSSPVVEIACGLHHTVVLTLSGEVYTFGSNQYGQLGTGDLQPYFGPVQVKIAAATISQVCAGSNHTVLLTTKGVVYTFGNHQKGQLGRLPNEAAANYNSNNEDGLNKSMATDHWMYNGGNSVGSSTSGTGIVGGAGIDDIPPSGSTLPFQRHKFLWHCTPGVVFGIGANYGKKATWIGASGDQTFFKIDESLITGPMLSKVNVVADKNTILLIPQYALSFNCLAINRRDGSCMAHCQDQVDFAKIISANNTAIDQLASDKCNQNNIEINNLFPPPTNRVASASLQDRMSQSVHEARNQIFNLQEHFSFSTADHQRGGAGSGVGGGSIGSNVGGVGGISGKGNKKRPSIQGLGDAGQQAVSGILPPQSQNKTYEKILPQLAFALDTCYGVLWVFNAITKKVQCYNVIASEISNNNSITTTNTGNKTASSGTTTNTNNNCSSNANARSNLPTSSSYLKAILSPELALPQKQNISVTRAQASLNILACLDILTSGQDMIPACFEQVPTRSTSPTKDAQNREYQLVSRFDNFGGGWGYSGHSVEAIRFMADSDIVLFGFAMFGGRGEYSCKLKLYDLGPDDNQYDEDDGILISETDEVPYECPARSKYNIMLPKPVQASAGKWFLVWARISGPSSDCGSSGQGTVTTEDQIVFSFKTSKKANNGTDVNSGQIPSILYRVVTQETKPQTISALELDPVYRISRMFANTVTKECFESLIRLLNWSWGTFKVTLVELKDKKKLPQTMATLNRLFYINKSCLRLLRKYTNEIYPNNILAKVDKNKKLGVTSHGVGGIGGGAGSNSNPSGVGGAGDSLSSNAITKTAQTQQIYVLNQGPSTSKNSAAIAGLSSGVNGIVASGVPTKYLMGSSMDASTPTNMKKTNTENLQLAESIGDVRALLIQILCDELPCDIEPTGYETTMDILDECHTTFLSCFNAFYPTSSLKWNCLCDLLAQKDKGQLHAQLLSAIVGGLCNPNVKLRNTFSLLATSASHRESKSIVSPSDNSGLPMLTSTENHQYPVLVEQMIYRTQQEKNFTTNTWQFKDILIRLLDIIAHPIKSKIENIYNRSGIYLYSSVNSQINQKLIDNCCHLLARVLSEIVYQSCSVDVEFASTFSASSRSLHITCSRFGRCDVARTWNTGNFGPDAISFSVDRPGIAIAGAMVYSGSGSYEFQLELLYDAIETHSASQHKWETLESISGTYDQDAVHGDMAEIKFERPVHINHNTRYAIRLCSQGARTCSGDAGLTSIRGPCGTNFLFFPCDLSFNGTTPARGQIPCILYYSTPLKSESQTGKILSEIHARDTALQIATDITKKCTDLLVLARNTLAASSASPSDKSLNSSNNTQTIDSEQNITPIEEHFDVGFTNTITTATSNTANSNNTITNTPTSISESNNLSTARDLTKRIECFSKGIIETLKFDKRSTNPFEFEIEIGATEIHPKDVVADMTDKQLKYDDRISKMNGNRNIKNFLNEIVSSKSGSEEEDTTEMTVLETLRLFENKSASIFHTLLPLVFGHIGALASRDPKSSVQILSLIRDILPHVSALNQLYSNKEKNNAGVPGTVTAAAAAAASAGTTTSTTATSEPFKDLQMFGSSRKENIFAKDVEDAKQHLLDLSTTSNHYCIVESDHPYKSASISTFRVEFPPSVQWFTVEFDQQCGTAQPEDYLVISIPTKSNSFNEIQQQKYQDEQLINADGTGQSNFSRSFEDNENVLNDRFLICRNACITSSFNNKDDETVMNCNSKSAVPTTNNDLDDDDRFIVKVFNGTTQWTHSALILPGNRIDFSLETASLYAPDQQQANKYGFRCLIVGYENPSLKIENSSLSRLECELAYLGGMCSANLMKKDLILPGDNPSEDFSGIEDTIQAHSTLLSKGLAISDSVLTVNQALDTYLPIGGQSNERQFLKDFVNAAPGSSGARLAAWLQPEPRLDPNRCELKTIQEPVRCGWPTQLTIITRDQYGDEVYIPELKIEIKATPSGAVANGGRKPKKQTENVSYRNMTLPTKVPYEATIKDKMCFKAITFMKAYQHYSFEELRCYNPVQTRLSELMLAQDLGDQTFGTVWTPTSIGSFCVTIIIDGIPLEEVYRVDVKDAGNPPPPQKSSLKKSQPTNKLRKFIAKNSAGLRIRSHPTLQSEQVGIVKVDGIILFIDEVENDDGIWVRLSTESIRQHCVSGWYPSEAWCLQYNQHLGRTLLHPFIEPQTTTATAATTPTPKPPRDQGQSDGQSWSTEQPPAPTPPTTEKAVEPSQPKESTEFLAKKCNEPFVGKLSQGISSNPFLFSESPIESDDGTKLNESINPFSCLKSDKDDLQRTISTLDDLCSGGVSSSGGVGLFDSQTTSKDLPDNDEDDEKHQYKDEQPTLASDTPPLHRSPNNLSQSPNQLHTALVGVVGGGASKLQALHKWFKGDSLEGRSGAGVGGGDFSKKRNELSELASVSVRDMVKAIGGGGSGVSSGPDTPTLSSSPSSKFNGNELSILHHSRSSTPAAVPSIPESSASGRYERHQHNQESIGSTSEYSKSIELSDRSMVVNSLAKDISVSSSAQSSSKQENPVDSVNGSRMSESTHTQPKIAENNTVVMIRKSGNNSPVPPQSPKYNSRKGRQKRTATILSAEGLFSNNSYDEEKDSILTITTTTTGNSSTPSVPVIKQTSPFKIDRNINHTSNDINNGVVTTDQRHHLHQHDEVEEEEEDHHEQTEIADEIPIAKRALPSSLAESLRAVFAAFLWHEGIVHDAMACSSFLKFHPTLPKDTALINAVEMDEGNEKICLSREQRAKQRYSVEVANAGNYLNIRPSTLETLTKSGNSSILNRRNRQKGCDGGGGSGNIGVFEQPKLHALPEVVTICPPALRCLVYLWEQLCSNCVQIVQSNADLPAPVPPISSIGGGGSAAGSKHTSPSRNLLNKQQACNIIVDQEAAKKMKKKKKDEGTWCELCEIFLPIPVTYHMRIVHPGCEKPAKGKGYNSVGTYCEGWAGNCGEGGKGASSWYLMCEKCREKYMTKNMNINNINSSPAPAINRDQQLSSSGLQATPSSATPTKFPPINKKYENIFGIKSNLIVNSEVYTMMKENSLFLLELSATGPGGMLTNQKRSPQQMPVVTETQLHQIASDLNKPGTSRGGATNTTTTTNTCKSGTGAASGSNFSASTPYRRSDQHQQQIPQQSPPTCISPELIWQAPDTFSCLESLGVSMTNHAAAYTIFDINSTDAAGGIERPLSEVSCDSIDRNGLMTNSQAMSGQQSSSSNAMPTNSLSRFHRSMSMGQGWSLHGKSSHNEIFHHTNSSSKVIMRRRNNSTCDDGGTMLLCNPSENLRKLVPDTVINMSHSIIKNASTLSSKPVNSVDNEKSNTKNSLADTRSSVVSDFTIGRHDYHNFFRNENDEPNNFTTVVNQASAAIVPATAIAGPSSSAPALANKKNKLERDLSLNRAEHSVCLLSRPTMIFILQPHNLEKLRFSLKRNLRISTCRIYSLQSLNWLMRSVTQPSCLHDLMWWFVTSLKPVSLTGGAAVGNVGGGNASSVGKNGKPVLSPVNGIASGLDDVESGGNSGGSGGGNGGVNDGLGNGGNIVGKMDEHIIEQALDHPVASNQMCGKISQLLTQSFHNFLQTVADLTLLLPAGSALQQIAIQCFGIKFLQADHQFLHRSHVFGNISKILSRTDEQNEDNLLLLSSAAMLESNSNFWGHGHHGGGGGHDAKISSFVDLNGMFDITVSSRQAMIPSLIDQSTETFWESDEEDRNKSKIIEISMNKLSHLCKILFVHIDNSRDVQTKVSNIQFYSGQSLGDTNLIKTIDLDATSGTWISAAIRDETHTHFRLELRGTENTLRVRQVKLLGIPAMSDDHPPRQNPKLTNAFHIQQRNCEAETLRVFRLITAQVFGKLILVGEHAAASVDNHPRIGSSASGGGNGSGGGTAAGGGGSGTAGGLESSANSLLADSLDLREHMVGILFSRSKLNHLQKQVIVHIVYAIRKETQRAKEEWEILNTTAYPIGQITVAGGGGGVGAGGAGGAGGADENGQLNNHQIDIDKSESSSENSRVPDTYCFEMLSMVLALSGSTVGRAYLSQQHGLIKDLLSLLHTGSDRVQRQVTALLRRILPEIVPETLAELLNVSEMPSDDFHIVHQSNDTETTKFNMHRLGILDIFLSVIAKSLQLQVKIKNSSGTVGGIGGNGGGGGGGGLLNKNPITVKLANCIDLNVDQEICVDQIQSSKKSNADDEDDDDDDDDNDNDNFGRENLNECGKNKKSAHHSSVENQQQSSQRWWLKGSISIKQAENIIGLIRDMTSGKFSEKWSKITKAAIGESILNLTRLNETFRTNELCIKTPTMWLALASLCVLDRDHVDRLSSGQWSNTTEQRPFCLNHDDGITIAIIQCQVCGSLCGDCDRFLHLNRKTRHHSRTVCKEEEEAIRVELHESCGRTKLFWLLALADSRTLKAMVEFRDGSSAIISGPTCSVGRCRFCGVTGNSGLLAIGNVCADEQCQEHAAKVCSKTKLCGHPCGGIAHETNCLPCLQVMCHGKDAPLTDPEGVIIDQPKLTQDADDMCMICFVEALSCAPAIQLVCGHVFHYHCARMVLEKRWNGPRISFGFSQCPICKSDIAHQLLYDVLDPINNLKNDVKRKALMRLEYEGIVKTTDHRDLVTYAMDRYAYYVCFKCEKAYYGGEARCDAEIGDKYNPEELVCGGCSDVARAQMCPKHGTDFLEYKCRYCCAVAVFFCFGTTHFCDTCHDDFQRLTNIPKSKLPRCPAGPKAKQLLGEDCPLHVVHPPTGEEFALGCGVCRNAQTF